MNRGFFPSDGFLLDNIDKIRHIKTTIVQVNILYSSIHHGHTLLIRGTIFGYLMMYYLLSLGQFFWLRVSFKIYEYVF